MPRRAQTLAIVAYALATIVCGLVWFAGQHDNDWPLLMWLAHHVSFADLSPLAIGHYSILQLLLVRALGALVGCLAAAKLLNAVATAGFLLVARAWLDRSGAPAVTTTSVLIGLMVSMPVFLSAQSEFGDPLATLSDDRRRFTYGALARTPWSLFERAMDCARRRQPTAQHGSDESSCSARRR